MATEDFLTDSDEVEAAVVAILGRQVGMRMDRPGFDLAAEVASAAVAVRSSGRDDRHARTIRLAAAATSRPVPG